MLTALTLCLLQSAPFAGTFRADQGVVTLAEKKGAIRGTIVLGSERVALRGNVSGGVLKGRAVDGYRKEFDFRATLIDGVLSLTIETDTIDFTREPKKAPARRSPTEALAMRASL